MTKISAEEAKAMEVAIRDVFSDDPDELDFELSRLRYIVKLGDRPRSRSRWKTKLRQILDVGVARGFL